MSTGTPSAEGPAVMSASDAEQLLSDQGSWYRPVAPPVHARLLEEEHRWTSSNGSELVGAAGSFLVSDGTESWTVDATIFASTYEPVGDGLYRKTGRARLWVLDRDLVVESLEGPSGGSAGDLLAGGEAGDVWIMPATKLARYELDA